jgi:outer membrane protein TolC
MKPVLLNIILIMFAAIARGSAVTDTTRLSLGHIVEMAKDKSIASKQAYTIRETRYWQWKTYKSNYQPQLSLHGIAPSYNRSFIPVLQPNGTIFFQPVNNNYSLLNLNFSQSIAATGGTIYGTTQIQRFDDYDRKNTLYNGVPYAIGINQPLFCFNSLKWDKKIEPLKYNENRQAFIESLEQISVTATGYYFDLLLAQVNLHIAETNHNITNNILRIANEKFELGKVSKNEILQLQLEALKAQKAVGIAKRDMEIAGLNLKSYTGLQNTEPIELMVPDTILNIQIPAAKVLSEAYENRSDAIAFVRKLIEAKRDLSKAKGDNGLNATLTGMVGYSNSSPTVSKLYVAPQNQQMIQLEFDIPILDWGRSKSREKTAAANLKFVQYALEQDKQIFAQQIITQATLYDMMKDQLLITAKADSIASEKSVIAKDRYVLGNLSITDLSIAFQEKDQAKRDYIYALRDYWSAFYQLRYLSLYDFVKNEKIIYK